VARGEVLREHLRDPETGRHWHLARVYAGPGGGGPVCAAGASVRAIQKDVGYAAFLDKERQQVPVASAREFVGRRRQAQDIFRAYRDGRTGVLVHGMCNLGKSSLAARVANRMPSHQAVVIFGDYDPVSVFERLVAAVPPADRDNWRGQWGEAIAAKGAALADALEAMLTGPFGGSPILLIVDDLEKILEEPAPGTDAPQPVALTCGDTSEWRETLTAILQAFKTQGGASRLLLTSRYRFTLPDGPNDDLADTLLDVPLRPMGDTESDKQWCAASAAAGQSGRELDDEDGALNRRVIAAARGNPGLQQTFCRPILNGETIAAEDAVAKVEHFLETGEVPTDESAAQEFFQRMSFETYANALTEPQKTQLRAATLFSPDVPTPGAARAAAGAAAGVGDAGAALNRLSGLGLLTGWGEIGGVDHAAVDPLARPLVPGELSEDGAQTLASAAILPLAKAWRDEDGDFPVDPRSLEAARICLLGDVPVDILDSAAVAAGDYLFRRQDDARAALDLMKFALGAIDRQEVEPSPNFILMASNCAQRVGETDVQIKLLERGLALQTSEEITIAPILAAHAEATFAKDPDASFAVLDRATKLFSDVGDERALAMTKGRIADILARRGETEEALRIRRKEEMPVYKRLGGVRSIAVTMGKIADILSRRGETDEALRIRREEELPVYERLGDVREQAVAMGKIANILTGRGETEEALRIFCEETVPVFERLGDVRSLAVTMGQVADILTGRGETEEALRIRREEELPVYERLGDVRSFAVGNIADILSGRGETDEALRIQIENILPVVEAMQDIDGIANVRFKCAQIRLRRGGHESGEAQTIADELSESFEITLKLQRADGIAASGILLGQVLAGGGLTEQALEVLDVSAVAFEKLEMQDELDEVRQLQEQIRADAADDTDGEDKK
jgi:tetratricopeptide (TPR) repeat protein